MFKYFLVSILCLFSAVIFAADSTQNILIYFDKGLGRNFKEGSQNLRGTPNYTCTSDGKFRYVGWTYAETNKSMDVNTAGDFLQVGKDGTCSTDGLNNTDRKPYVLINGLTVSFVYNNVPHRCEINSTLGLAYYKSLFTNYNRLVTNEPDMLVSCKDIDDGFKYEITPGGWRDGMYKKGHITIYYK